MGSTSTVVHGLPIDSDEDLGWLACWASNDVGNQREPCLFRIMPAGNNMFKIQNLVGHWEKFIYLVTRLKRHDEGN